MATDIELSCDEPWRTPMVAAALEPKPYWKYQPFEYLAAQYLVGSGLTDGDLEGHIRSLAHELQRQYELGVEHGIKSPEFATGEAVPTAAI
jgi:hypothetical protein